MTNETKWKTPPRGDEKKALDALIFNERRRLGMPISLLPEDPAPSNAEIARKINELIRLFR